MTTPPSSASEGASVKPQALNTIRDALTGGHTGNLSADGQRKYLAALDIIDRALSAGVGALQPPCSGDIPSGVCGHCGKPEDLTRCYGAPTATPWPEDWDGRDKAAFNRALNGAADAAQAPAQAAPVQPTNLFQVKQIIDERNAAHDLIRKLETVIAEQQEKLDAASPAAVEVEGLTKSAVAKMISPWARYAGGQYFAEEVQRAAAAKWSKLIGVEIRVKEAKS
jgi:hypothetical protein